MFDKVVDVRQKKVERGFVNLKYSDVDKLFLVK